MRIIRRYKNITTELAEKNDIPLSFFPPVRSTFTRKKNVRTYESNMPSKQRNKVLNNKFTSSLLVLQVQLIIKHEEIKRKEDEKYKSERARQMAGEKKEGRRILRLMPVVNFN